MQYFCIVVIFANSVDILRKHNYLKKTILYFVFLDSLAIFEVERSDRAVLLFLNMEYSQNI